VPSFISIGCQTGGPEAGVVGSVKVPLYHALARHVTSSHCAAVEEYALVLRIDGSLDKFGAEGLSHLRFARKQRYVTIDIQIPESAWQPLKEPQLRAYLVRQVKSAIEACVSKLKREKLQVDDHALRSEIDAAALDYLAGTKAKSHIQKRANQRPERDAGAASSSTSESASGVAHP
jgi:hypothetical protein